MSATLSGLQRWTKRFTVASAGAFLTYLFTVPVVDDHRIGVLICVFGFVCPMVFGMAYLLLPPYVGRTLVDYRLPGVHFVLAYLGAGLLVLGRATDGTGALFALGAVSWAGGVAVFVGSLAATVGPVLISEPTAVLQGGDRPQRSNEFATATIPVAIGYLVVGTVALLAAVEPLGIGSATIPAVVHYYVAGFGTLLIFALGVRLLDGFFHVSPPNSVVRVVLTAGIAAPAFLGSSLWRQPWFRVGAVLASVAMGGYLLLVAFVAVRTDRTRPGLYGIVLGAVAGTMAVAFAGPLAFGAGQPESLELHRTFVLRGFFPLTIVGYAYQFFPVTDPQFLGSAEGATVTTIGLLAAGVLVQGIGIWLHSPLVVTGGVGGSVLGTLGFTILMVQRFRR